MTARAHADAVRLAVEEKTVCLPLNAILPLREVPRAVRQSAKFAQIAASIAEVGVIEPPVVARTRKGGNEFHLLDGHMRLAILRDRGEQEVECLVALDDEAYTYNKRVSRLAVIQEHQMLLNAVNRGVSEERLSRALNVNIVSIRNKRKLLSGICPEVVELLKDKNVPMNIFTELRFLKPIRQIEVAQLMIVAGRISTRYVKSLVAATPPDQLTDLKRRNSRAMSKEQVALIQRESANLEREFRVVEQSYGANQLDLILTIGFVATLLANARVIGYLARYHPEILAEFQKLVDYRSGA